MVAQPGWSYLLGRYHAGRILGISAVFWGIMVLVMVWSKNFTHVMVTRFFLGVFEAAVTPGLSLMTGWWYRREEIPLRQTIWYSAIGWSGMIVSPSPPNPILSSKFYLIYLRILGISHGRWYKHNE
jgi:MFS family permease